MNRKQKRRIERGAFLTVIAILIFFLGGWISSILNLFGCNGGACCGRVNPSISATFTLTVNGTEIPGAYVGNLELDYMPIANDLYQFWIAHPEFDTMDELLTYWNATHPVNGTDPIESYTGWSYFEFEDARAIFDDSQYDNISINGQSFSVCITGVALVPYVSIEVFYENGTTYDYFDFALMTVAEIAEIADLEDPFDLIDHLPGRLIVECGETLSFTVLDVVWDGDDIVVDVNADGVEIACPQISFWGPW